MTDEMFSFYEEIRRKKKVANGVHGMSSGRRPARPRLSIEGESSSVLIKDKSGKVVVIPSSEIMKNGKIKKTYLRKVGLL